MELLYDLAIPLFGIYPKKPKTLTQKICVLLFSWSVIYNSQDIEATQMLISRRVDKKAGVHLQNGILLWHEERMKSYLCDSMNRPKGHYFKLNTSDRES